MLRPRHFHFLELRRQIAHAEITLTSAVFAVFSLPLPPTRQPRPQPGDGSRRRSRRPRFTGTCDSRAFTAMMLDPACTAYSRADEWIDDVCSYFYDNCFSRWRCPCATFDGPGVKSCAGRGDRIPRVRGEAAPHGRDGLGLRPERAYRSSQGALQVQGR